MTTERCMISRSRTEGYVTIKGEFWRGERQLKGVNFDDGILSIRQGRCLAECKWVGGKWFLSQSTYNYYMLCAFWRTVFRMWNLIVWNLSSRYDVYGPTVKSQLFWGSCHRGCGFTDVCGSLSQAWSLWIIWGKVVFAQCVGPLSCSCICKWECSWEEGWMDPTLMGLRPVISHLLWFLPCLPTEIKA